MKAYLVNQYRTPMQVGAAAEPTVGDREVLVDIHTAGVSHLDARIRDWDFKLFLPYKTPSILRHDLAASSPALDPWSRASPPATRSTDDRATTASASTPTSPKRRFRSTPRLDCSRGSPTCRCTATVSIRSTARRKRRRTVRRCRHERRPGPARAAIASAPYRRR